MNLLIATVVTLFVGVLLGAARPSDTRRLSARGPHTDIGRPRVGHLDSHTRRLQCRLGRSPRVRPADLAAWVDHLARELRHGSTLAAALASVVPSDPAVASATDRLRHLLDRGMSVSDACDEWIVGADSGRLVTTIAAVLAATAVIGGSSSRPLEQLASALRQHASEELERDAQSAQARLSARVLTIVPIGVLGFMLATDGDVRDIIRTGAGASVVMGGLLANGIGAWWMRAVVAGSARREAGT